MTSTMRSQLHATAHALINSFREWTPEAILAIRTDDCTQQILPLSLERPPRRNEEYIAWFKAIIEVFRDFRPVVINDDEETMIDVERRSVCMHVRSTARVPWGDYRNEYCMRMWMTEDGKLVKKIHEFVDSGTTIEHGNKVLEFRAQSDTKSNVSTETEHNRLISDD